MDAPAPKHTIQQIHCDRRLKLFSQKHPAHRRRINMHEGPTAVWKIGGWQTANQKISRAPVTPGTRVGQSRRSGIPPRSPFPMAIGSYAKTRKKRSQEESQSIKCGIIESLRSRLNQSVSPEVQYGSSPPFHTASPPSFECSIVRTTNEHMSLCPIHPGCVMYRLTQYGAYPGHARGRSFRIPDV